MFYKLMICFFFGLMVTHVMSLVSTKDIRPGMCFISKEMKGKVNYIDHYLTGADIYLTSGKRYELQFRSKFKSYNCDKKK